MIVLNIVLFSALVAVVVVGAVKVFRLYRSIDDLNVEITRRLYLEWWAGEYRPFWRRVEKYFTLDGKR